MFYKYVSKKNIGETMKDEDNKNYTSVALVTLITLMASASIIYLLVKVLN